MKEAIPSPFEFHRRHAISSAPQQPEHADGREGRLAPHRTRRRAPRASQSHSQFAEDASPCVVLRRARSITTARLEPERAGERAAERRPERDAHQQRAARVTLQHFTSRGGMYGSSDTSSASAGGGTRGCLRTHGSAHPCIALYASPETDARQQRAAARLSDDRAARGEGRRDRKRHTQGGRPAPRAVATRLRCAVSLKPALARTADPVCR